MKLKKGVYGAMILAVALLVSAIPFFASAAQNDNDGYTIINTAAELDAIRNDLSGKYRLYSDIDLSGYTSETNTAANGWKPIAFYSSFRGELDGNGHTISGLWSMWGIENVGLFSGLSGASIHDLGIEIADAGLTGASEVGALAGFAMDGSIIENVSVHGGRIAATEGENAGGIAGVAYGSAAIRNCLVEGTETKASGSYSGALAGSLDEGSAIESSRAEGTFSEGVFYVGGLVGALKGGAKITGSFSSGEAVASAAYAGGLAGIVGEKSSIIESEATGNASANSSVGGLAGIVSGGSKLEKVGASGDATAFSGEKTGGLVGQLADSTIKNSYAHGNVKGATRIGGLVGSFSGTGSKSAAAASVENSYSTGIVTGIGATDYGAFNGRSDVKYLGTNYYDGDTASAPRAYGTGGSPSGDASAFPKSLTTAQLKSQSSYQGWDFAKVWTIDEGASYPYFRHSAPAPSPAPTATPIPPTPSPISLPTSAPTVIPFKTASPKPATTTPVPTSAPIRTATPRPTATGAPLKLITPTPNALSLDSDNDGLPDKVEISIGTDPFNKDTDGDGLSDGDEVNVYGTNPLKEDTDDDGLPDNVEIYDLLTDPLSEDSDGDGRTDVDEITNIRRSDPMVWDTDGDGARDGWEIENGYDPKKFNDLFKDSVETERIFDEEGHWYTIKATYEVPGRYAGKGKIARPKVTFNTLDTAGYMFPAIKLALDGNNNDNDTAYTDITYKIVFEQNIYKNVEARGYETLMGGPSSVPKTAKIDKESGFMEVTQKYRGGIFILNLNKKDDNIPSSTPMPTATPKPTNTPTRTAPPKPTTPIPTRTDSDNDGLLDSLEYYAHRTDLDNWDTDGDGLSDGDEVNVYDIAPLKADTDDDGLLDKDEVDCGTDPNLPDTDKDGLSDYEEVRVHDTDPLAWDTDGDGARDGWEIENGHDPKKFDDLFKLSAKIKEEYDNKQHWFTCEVKYEVPGKYVEKGKLVRCSSSFNDSNTKGYMFPAIRLNLDGADTDPNIKNKNFTYRFEFDQKIYNGVIAHGLEFPPYGAGSAQGVGGVKTDVGNDYLDVTQTYRYAIFILKESK